MRLLVCGSRTWTDRARLRREVEATVAGADDVVIIEGGARGADRMAGELARDHGWTHEVYRADWNRYGRSAGPRRNGQMLREGRPDLVLAFADPTLAETRGTADMVRKAWAAGVPVRVIEAVDPFAEASGKDDPRLRTWLDDHGLAGAEVLALTDNADVDALSPDQLRLWTGILEAFHQLRDDDR